MEHIGRHTEAIKAWAERCAARAADPEFQRNAARLAAENAEQERASRESERKAALRRCGVPEGVWGALQEPEETDALRAVRDFLGAGPRVVFCTLAGKKGRGKTFAVAWAVAQRGGRFVEAQDLVAAGSFDREFWDELEATPLLGLDELGGEHMNPAYEASLYALLNKRYQRGRKTVIGTNQNAPEFRERYGAGGLERLIERMQTAGVWVNLPGESMRRHWSEASDGGGA